MSYDELVVSIQDKDKEFADQIVRVLESCKNWKTIKPIRTNLIGEGCDLTALGECVDGGLPASRGSIFHINTQDHQTERKHHWCKQKQREQVYSSCK